MIEADKKEFKRMINAVMAIYYKPELTQDALRVWWSKLDKYDFSVVASAFDKYIDMPKQNGYSSPPEPSDIIGLCQHKITIHARLPSPLAIADNKRHSAEVVNYIAKNIKPKRDYRAWAHKIIENPSRYPDISFKIAKEALNARYE